MKRLGILLLAAMLGLVLACGSQEEKKPAPKAAEKVAPAPAPAAPAPAPAPVAPAPEKAAPPAAK